MCHPCLWIYLISYHHSWRQLQCWHQVLVSFFNSALLHLIWCMLKLIPQNHFSSDYDYVDIFHFFVYFLGHGSYCIYLFRESCVWLGYIEIGLFKVRFYKLRVKYSIWFFLSCWMCQRQPQRHGVQMSWHQTQSGWLKWIQMMQAVLPDQTIQPDLKWRLKDGENQRVRKILLYLLHVRRLLSTYGGLKWL